jgi:hypothetical protein
LLFIHTNSEIVHGFLELFLVKGSVTVVICDLEFLGDGRDTSGTSLSKSLSEIEEESLVGGV